jgi:hypothetical protein
MSADATVYIQTCPYCLETHSSGGVAVGESFPCGRCQAPLRWEHSPIGLELEPVPEDDHDEV